MNSVTRLTVGLYGFLFHVAAAALFALKAARNPTSDLPALLGPSAAAAVAAFVVYAFLVTPYARKRYGTAKKGVVFFDFLVGMLAEVAVVALAAFLFAIPAAATAPGVEGVGGFFSHLVSTTALAFLWSVGTAMTEVLVIGNAAGFVGYIVLKKLSARGARRAESGAQA